MSTATPTLAPAAGSPTEIRELSPRKAAIIAGIGYVALFVLAIFANFLVREALVVSGDAAATAANIADAEGTFRMGIVSFVAIFVIDVVVAWALYVVFRSQNRDLSLLAAWFRITYTVLLGVAIVFMFQALQLLSGAGFLAVVDTAVLEAQALVALDSFNATWMIGLVAFGLHLVVLGYVIVRTRVAPRALGYVLIVAGAAYVLDTSAQSLMSTYADHASLFLAAVAVPSILAEGWFGLWLLLRGGKAPADSPA